MYSRHFFLASEVFSTSAAPVLAGLPSFCDLKITRRLSSNLNAIGGCGLYFLVHKGYLVYIGKFLGSIHNAFGGDIFSARWNRHISTLSLRGSRISIGQATLNRAMLEGLPQELHHAMNGVASTSLAKDRGFMVPYKRLKYAALNWNDFSRAPGSWLADIKIGYLQLDPSLTHRYSIATLRDIVSDAEARAIAEIPTVLNGLGDFYVNLLKAMSSDEIFDLLAKILDVSLGKISQDKVQRQAAASETEVRDKENQLVVDSEFESDFYGERFLESLPSDGPDETVHAIYDAFEDAPDVQVHHTKTYGGDLRVRALNAPRRRNVFTMYWQPRKQLFSCKILLPSGSVDGTGIIAATASKGSEPLPTTFKFDYAQTGANANLVRLITQAVGGA